MSLLSVLLGSALAGCGQAASNHRIPPGAARVLIKGNPLGNPDSLYVPSRIRVRAGRAVVWIERDDSRHTVTPEFGVRGWRGGSPILSKGEHYWFRFTKPGIYRYHCMVHPNMQGSVIVIS